MQGARVQAAPPAVDALDLVRHDQVRVQLRIPGPRVEVIETRSDHASHGHTCHATVPDAGCRDPFLEQGQHVAHGGMVGLGDAGLRGGIGNAPQHAHRLRRREREIESRNGLGLLACNLLVADLLDRPLARLGRQLVGQARNAVSDAFLRRTHLRIRQAQFRTGQGVHAAAEELLEMLLGHRVTDRERWALSGVEAVESAAGPGAGRAARLGVVASQG